jgi:hypothetical protein
MSASPLFDPLPPEMSITASAALAEVLIPDPHLTLDEAEALQVIHPTRAQRALQDQAREKLRAAALQVSECQG